MSAEKQRLDKWLWYTRIVKSRTLAQKLVSSGAVRVNGTRVTGPDHRIGIDTVLTMNVHERIRILKVLDTGTRRGPAKEASTLYEDMSPQLPPRKAREIKPIPITREPGSGRPTKKQRRETNHLTAWNSPGDNS